MSGRAGGVTRIAEPLKRRGLLAGAAGLFGAGLARLTGPGRAEAGHNNTTTYTPEGVLHADVTNTTASATIIKSDSGFTPFMVQNTTADTPVGPCGIFAATSRENSGGQQGAGVFGLGTGGRGTGVAGLAEVSDGIGVYGAAARKFITEGGNPGSGVFGFGPTNGVAGRSDGAGVRGTSTPGTGVFGTSTSGVGSIGVSTSSVGVYGFSASAAGAFGKSATNVGLYGEGTQNAGVFGTSPVYGVWGRTNTGFGVNGEAVDNGIGVYGKAPAGGFAGYFEGRVFIAGVGILGSDSAMGVSGSPAASSAEEVGEARLVEGRATVSFDGDAVAALGKGPYQVFLTPYGEHHRLFVLRRGPDDFEMRAQGDPTASGTFSWRAVARRSRADSRSAERSDAPRVAMPKDVPVPMAPPALPLPDAAPNARQDAR